MKYIHVYALFLMSVFLTSCGQNQTNAPKDSINPITIGSEIKDIGPNMMVRNIKKGGNGTILIAGPNNSSFGDVFRYDGKSFTNLTSKIGPHRFWDVLEDRQGNTWFASTDSGVYRYNTSAPLSAGSKSFQHFTTREGLANNRVMSVYEDKAGIIWFGTGSGISRYDPSATLRTGSKSFRNFSIPNPAQSFWEKRWSNDITTIMEDKTGKLWVGTRGNVYVFDGKTFTTLFDQNGRTFNNVWSIIEDRKGNIWLGDVNGGIWRYDGKTFTKVSQRGAYAIIEDKKGNIWTTGPLTNAHLAVWAVSRYDANALTSDKPTVTEIITGNAFFGISEAEDGSIWFGSATGVYRYDGKTITDFYNKEGQKKYSIDTTQSAVVWKGSRLLGGWDGTTFRGDDAGTGDVDILKGDLLIENRHLVGGAAEIDMNTIKQKFNDPGPHNRLPPFFDVKKFPLSSFTITKVETGNHGIVFGNGNSNIEGITNMKVTGNLTIEGITKTVTFPANMYFKDGMDGTVVMNGALIVDRTDWGIDNGYWGIGNGSEKGFYQSGDMTISDDVKLFIKIVAQK